MATKEIQQPPAARPKNQPPKENVIKKNWDELVKYFKGVKTELTRVTWPSRQELRLNTIVVVVVVIGISGYMYLVDLVVTHLFRWFHRA